MLYKYFVFAGIIVNYPDSKRNKNDYGRAWLTRVKIQIDQEHDKVATPFIIDQPLSTL